MRRRIVSVQSRRNDTNVEYPEKVNRNLRRLHTLLIICRDQSQKNGAASLPVTNRPRTVQDRKDERMTDHTSATPQGDAGHGATYRDDMVSYRTEPVHETMPGTRVNAGGVGGRRANEPIGRLIEKVDRGEVSDMTPAEVERVREHRLGILRSMHTPEFMDEIIQIIEEMERGEGVNSMTREEVEQETERVRKAIVG